MENLTQLTQSSCPFWEEINLHSPRVFHTLIVLSLEPDTTCLESDENATELTSDE